MPYLVLEQTTRIAGEELAEAQRNRYREGAFIGWQMQRIIGGAFGGRRSRPPTFEAYLRAHGLKPAERAAKGAIAREKRQAAANADLVRQAFAARGVRKAST